MIRAAQMNRSIYQNNEGNQPIDETAAAQTAETAAVTDESANEEKSHRPNQTLVETYFANVGQGSFAGVNFATLQPINETPRLFLSDRAARATVRRSGSRRN